MTLKNRKMEATKVLSNRKQINPVNVDYYFRKNINLQNEKFDKAVEDQSFHVAIGPGCVKSNLLKFLLIENNFFLFNSSHFRGSIFCNFSHTWHIEL